MQDKTITIRIPADLEKAVRDKAVDERRSLSQQIRVILENWIKTIKQ